MKKLVCYRVLHHYDKPTTTIGKTYKVVSECNEIIEFKDDLKKTQGMWKTDVENFFNVIESGE